MSQRERALKQELERFIEELRRLHSESIRAANEMKIAASLANDASTRFSKSEAKLEGWLLSIEKRVQKIERWQAGLVTAGIVAGALVWEKAKKALGI